MTDYLALHPIGNGLHLWQLLTYGILHADILHLAANVLLLWMFGRRVKGAWLIGIVAQIGGGLVQLLLMDTPLIGASPAALAMVMAYGLQKPTARCWFLVPMTAEMLAFVMFTFNLLSALTLDLNVGWWSHVGGMMAAWAVVRARE